MAMGFPGLQDFNRRTIRAEVNPLDKSTIVSIYPKEIHEEKCTIEPGIFEITAGSYDKPALLIVGPSSWWKEIMEENQPLLEIPVSSIQIADSFVKDYCNGLLACDMANIMPGIFYIPGEQSLLKIQKDYKPLLDKALANQKRWYQLLVRMADSLWARSNGNPLTISDDMRLAAKELNLNKEWLKDYQLVEMIRCVACGALRDPRFPICRECKAIADPEMAKKLNLTFAQ